MNERNILCGVPPQFGHNMKVISNCGFIGESLWLILHVIQGDGGCDYK